MINLNENFTQSIPFRLRVARICRGYHNRISFALACGIPSISYQAHENGNEELNLRDIIIYIHQLNISPWWLITGEGSPLSHIKEPNPNEMACFRYQIEQEKAKLEITT